MKDYEKGIEDSQQEIKNLSIQKLEKEEKLQFVLTEQENSRKYTHTSKPVVDRHGTLICIEYRVRIVMKGRFSQEEGNVTNIKK